MKKIIIVLLSLALILGGCLMDPFYIPTMNEYYDPTADGNYQIAIANQGAMFVLMDGDIEIGMAGEVYPSSEQTIRLEYMYEEGMWRATYTNGDEAPIGINPKDAYAYINDVAPMVIYELGVAGERNDTDLTSLEGGDKTIVEELLKDDV